jgi:hypothetical protein
MQPKVDSQKVGRSIPEKYGRIRLSGKPIRLSGKPMQPAVTFWCGATSLPRPPAGYTKSFSGATVKR